MTFINTNLDDVAEPQLADPGYHNLQIVDAKEMQTGPNSARPGSPMIAVNIGFVDDPDLQNFTHFVNLPHEDDEPKSAKYKALMLKRLLVLFSVPYDSAGIDTEKLCMDLPGASANAEVGIDEYQGRTNNTLKLPPLAD